MLRNFTIAIEPERGLAYTVECCIDVTDGEPIADAVERWVICNLDNVERYNASEQVPVLSEVSWNKNDIKTVMGKMGIELTPENVDAVFDCVDRHKLLNKTLESGFEVLTEAIQDWKLKKTILSRGRKPVHKET